MGGRVGSDVGVAGVAVGSGVGLDSGSKPSKPPVRLLRFNWLRYPDCQAKYAPVAMPPKIKVRIRNIKIIRLFAEFVAGVTLVAGVGLPAGVRAGGLGADGDEGAGAGGEGGGGEAAGVNSCGLGVVGKGCLGEGDGGGVVDWKAEDG